MNIAPLSAEIHMKSNLPEILYSSSIPSESQKIIKLLKRKQIRKILPKAYTSNFEDEDAIIVNRHLFPLISRHYPGSLISYRTAIEYTISPKSNIYLTTTQNRVVKWPGVTLKFTKGHGPLENDNPLYKDVYVTSQERTLLENLSFSRAAGGELKTLPVEIIEEKLLLILNKGGEKNLNEFRDKAKEISELLGLNKEFDLLNKKIGALLSTKPTKILTSAAAKAQSYGEPYDPIRLNLFQKLSGVLRNSVFKQHQENAKNAEAFKTFAFFESYFSNYIEGTTFEIEEAIDIVYKNQLIPNRMGDTHDVKGTFEICSDNFEMKRAGSTPKEFIELLQSRHAVILGGRPDKEPGLFKEIANRAGDSHFVLPKMVKGTLKAGFEGLASIPTALGRAMYMMFLISEVHPFNDGNGRIARIMMNSELVQSKEQRIIIPTVYRDDYIGGLKKLTKKQNPDVYIAMMERAHEFSFWLQPDDFDNMLNQLKSSNALEESHNGVLKWQ